MKQNSLETLGYQLRVASEKLELLWPVARREQYLLNPYIRLPMSVDEVVWPIADEFTVADQVFDDFVSGPGEAPNGLNLFRLSGKLTASIIPSGGDCRLVGIAVDNDVAIRIREKNFIVGPSRIDGVMTLSMQILGFDVCDDRLTSGLMNYGFEVGERKRLRSTYAELINHCGLFDSRENAVHFANEINGMSPEHAPFFAAELFVVIGIRK